MPPPSPLPQIAIGCRCSRAATLFHGSSLMTRMVFVKVKISWMIWREFALWPDGYAVKLAEGNSSITFIPARKTPSSTTPDRDTTRRRQSSLDTNPGVSAELVRIHNSCIENRVSSGYGCSRAVPQPHKKRLQPLRANRCHVAKGVRGKTDLRR